MVLLLTMIIFFRVVILRSQNYRNSVCYVVYHKAIKSLLLWLDHQLKHYDFGVRYTLIYRDSSDTFETCSFSCFCCSTLSCKLAKKNQLMYLTLKYRSAICGNLSRTNTLFVL